MKAGRKPTPKALRRHSQAERARKLAAASPPLVEELYLVHAQVCDHNAGKDEDPPRDDHARSRKR